MSSKSSRASRRRRVNSSSFRRLLRFETFEARRLLAVYEVSSLDDSGPNTLRQAILDANTSPGGDSIVFAIPGVGPHTIAPITDLPGITQAIIIDGTSQAGYAGTPLIEINGAGAGASASGLLLDSGSNGSTIKGLTINRFAFGLFLLSPNNSISENVLGTDPLGTTDLGNLEYGVFVQFGSNGNLIRDNLVSGNDGTGILLVGNNNRVEGNKIGTNAAGTAAIANSRGVDLASGSTGNTIGGNVSGAGNLISGNTNQGVAISSNLNKVQGNIIGLNAAGTGAVPNNRGVDVSATSVLIGTDGDGLNDANERNVISGNTNFGVIMIGGGSNRVAGNYIGTRADGTGGGVGNGDGVFLQSTSGNFIGTDGSNDAFNANERNIISGNTGRGVVLVGANVVAGNWIGLDVTGTIAANQGGVQVTGTGSRVGTNADGIADAEERNVISGNTLAGIIVRDATTSGAVIAGNFIGTDSTGNLARPNASGVTISGGASNNTIGGTAIAQRNIISGNSGFGVSVSGAATAGNIISGNYIGTAVTGLAAIGNTSVGVNVVAGAVGTIIGGSVAGAGNVISGSVASNGVAVSGVGTDGTMIQGNFIGTDKNGTAPLPNFFPGVAIINGATNTQLGGLTATPGTGAGNVISGNREHGVLVRGTGTSDTTIRGNLVGLAAGGTAVLGNGTTGSFAGIAVIDGATNTTIGGTNSLSRNVVSGNENFGITTLGSGVQIVTNTIIQGNYVGTNISGTAAIPNGRPGIGILDKSATVTIGGSVSGAGNLISGNSGGGVFVSNLLGTGEPTGVFIQGNQIGTNAAGTGVIPNTIAGTYTGAGVEIRNASDVNIGGTTVDARNIISGNVASGILITGATSTNNRVWGNYIGLSVNGATDLGNNNGVEISDAPGNLIGGGLPGAGNVIGGNAIDVSVAGLTATGNRIQGNRVSMSADGLSLIEPSLGYGVYVANGATDTLIGTDSNNANDATEGNLIGFASTAAIFLQDLGVAPDRTVVAGNRLGLNALGATLSTGVRGIWVGGATNTRIGTDSNGTSDNEERNVIVPSANGATGILLTGGSLGATTGTKVAGNYIGVDTTGEIGLSNNTNGGIVFDAASGNGISNTLIGGTQPSAKNVIGSLSLGIQLAGQFVINNTIQGNYIGTDKDGVSAIPNTIGIEIALGVAGTIVGGFTSIAGTGAGNVISGNSGRGIWDAANSSGTIIRGNLIGLGADGVTDLGNGLSGIQVNGLNTLIGGDDDDDGTLDGNVEARNVISGNTTQGINIGHSGSVRNTTVQGNYIGTNRAGTSSVSNSTGGVVVGSAPGTRIGGTTAGAGNVISGNAGAGLAIVGISYREIDGLYNAVVEGNIIGLNAAGTAAVANSTGVSLSSTNSGPLNGGNRIGGTTAAARNVISGNSGNGVVVSGVNAIGNVIVGNYIGTNATGTTPIGNATGIQIDSGASGNTVGGTAVGSGNVISGNRNGISLVATLNNSIVGNYIGTDDSGTLDLGNIENGISIVDATQTRIGGSTFNDRNRIAFNAIGVSVVGNTSGNRIQRNAIYSNDRLGIDLGGDGVTTNDSNDVDTGANGLQNYPVLSTPVAGARTQVIGQLNSAPNSTFAIDFYASRVGDPSGFGEAERYLGTISVMTNLSGIAAFDQLVPGITVNGDLVTAIATDSAGNSSEFSAWVGALSTAPPTINPNDLILTEIVEEDGFGSPTLSFTEGAVVRMDGLFANLDPTDAHTIRVDWGDGTSEDVIVVNSGPRGFTAEHIYSDDRPSGTNQDIYVINVFVTDDDNSSGFASISVSIVNSPAVFAGPLTFTPASLFEGGMGTLSGSFTDPGDDTHRLQINWGDGGGPQVLTLPPGARTFSVPHTFRDNTSSLSINLLDDDTVGAVLPDSRSVNVNILNLPPVPSISAPASGIEGVPFTLIASVFDPGIADSQSLVWEVNRNGISLFEVTGNLLTFTPSDDGNYSATLTATDDEGASGSVTQSFVVNNATPVIAASNLSLRAPNGTPLVAAAEGKAFDLVGTFTDGGSGDTHSVTIDWGDGSPVTVLNLPRGARAFSAPHVYADDNPTGTSVDPYPVIVRVTDNSNATGSATKVVQVANTPPVVQVIDHGSDDMTVRLRALVQDDSSLDTHVFSWSISGAVLPPSTLTNQAMIEFSRNLTPTLGDGFIQASVTVRDDDLGADTAVAVVVIGTNDQDLITVDPTSPGNIEVKVITGTSTLAATFPIPKTVVVLGRNRDDTIIVNAMLNINASLDGGTGHDTIISSKGNDTIVGGDGNDSIVSGDGHDIVDASVGNDTVNTGDGNDTTKIYDFSDKTLSDSSGIDTIDFSGVSAASIDPANGVSLNLSIDDGTRQAVRTGGSVSLAGMYENVLGTQFKDLFIGNSADNLLFGGGDDDSIVSGAGGNDTIDGGSGDDSLNAGGGNDLIFGGIGDDTVVSGSGDESIDGGSGNDLIFGGDLGDDTIDGGSGDDSIEGGAGNDLIFGGEDEDTIVSGSGDESIDGGSGNDVIFGAAGGDDTIDGGAGDDSIVGGTGNDLIFGGDDEDTIVSGSGDESIVGGEGNDLIFGGDDDGDTIQGGGGDDSIVGGDGNDLIFGGEGDDTIEAGAGDESIHGGSGNDLIFGADPGDDTIDGGAGDDSIQAGSGNDLIFGGSGDDTIQAGAGDQSILGGSGNDLIFGDALGDDTLDGGSGDDSIVGGQGNDLIFGGDGDDTIVSGSGDESIVGGNGNDLIFGGDDDGDTIQAGSGDDSIVGGAGNDLIFGGDGDDTIQAGVGDESINGGSGNDLIFGDGAGNDTLDGGAGDDSIAAGAGNDLIFGGSGDDTIEAGSGDQSILGGSGNDLIFGDALGADTIDGGTGDDSIVGGQGNDLIFGGAGQDTIVAGDGDETIDGGSGNDLIFGGETNDDSIPGGTSDDSILGGDGNDIIFGGDAGNDTIDAGAGNDSIVGAQGNDLIFGGAGDDTIEAGGGDETILGGDGNDLIFGGDGGNDTIAGGQGDDSIIGGEWNDRIFGDAGDDTIVSSAGTDTIDGGSGNDLIFAAVATNAILTANTLSVAGQGLLTFSGIEQAWLQGNSAANTLDASAAGIPVLLDGAAGDDLLLGGAYDDVLVGGGGNDTLVGAGGNDTYRFDRQAAGHQWVNETTGSGEDTLDFAGYASGVNVDLSSVLAQLVAPGLTLTLVGNLENAFGTEYNDSLIGNSLDNKLFGINGNDSLVGGAGNDTLSAGRRRVVFLDFDSASEVGEYVYTSTERIDIQARMAWDYRVFDIEFTQVRPTVGPYVTVAFNAAVFNPNSQSTLGGISERVGWRELTGSGTVQVDINGFLGTGTNKLTASTENVIALSSTIGAHELAHFYGLRHQDAFGAPGTGVFLGLGNQNRFRPIYTGPTAAQETRLHLIASPASIRTTLVDALGNPFFGEREALKLAFAESGSVVPEAADGSKEITNLITNLVMQSVLVQPLGELPAMSVPNTIEIGVNQGATLTAAALAVTGAIQLSTLGTSENDYYSFSGTAGDVVTIEVMSQILRHRIGNPIDSILRVYNSAGQKVAYYSSTLGAFNDDTFEPTDSVLIDLILPTTDTYTVEVDTFSFAAPEFLAYAPPGFNVTQFAANNPNNVAVTDRDTGPYELLIYRFNGTVPAVAVGDILIGGAGNDILIGNSGKEAIFGYNPNQDRLFDPSGGSSFTSNPPVLQTIVDQTGNEGSPLTFTAVASDIDDDFSHFSLESVVGFAFPVGATFNAQTGAFSFTPSDQGNFKVRVVAHDFSGVTDSREVVLTALNVNPTVAIVGARATSSEGTAISFTSTASDPAGANDPLTYAWSVTKNGSPFDTGTSDTFNFTPNDNGTYQVTLTVSDGDGGSATDSKTVNVANVNPTAALAGPTTTTAGTAITITSTASDPAGANDPLSYAWSITRDGNPFAIQVGGTSYTFTPALAGIYAVALAVSDGDGGLTTATQSVLVTGSVVNHPPVVTIQTPVDGVFGKSSLFTFRATDADTMDQSGLFVYSINWGDGKTETVTGLRVKTVSHTYTGVSSTGIFKITASATDARGAVGPNAIASFVVLGWTVMVDPIHSGKPILVVVGTQGNDDIKIQDKQGDYLRVKIRDRDDWVRYKGTVLGNVDRILVFGHAGNDKITIDDDIDIDAQVWGGTGDDKIKGGSGNDVIFGEAGDDEVLGGDGRDILIGGTGKDRLRGDKHDDILIGGYTAFDQEFNLLAPASNFFPTSAWLSLDDQRLAVEAIMAEWASNRSYNQRRANINGTGTDPRNNGTKYLKFDDVVIGNNTVFDDGVEDTMWGDSGLDWFLANLDGPLSTRDTVKDRSGLEVVSDTDRWW